MKAIEVKAIDLFNAGRWRVEIFTDDNSEKFVSRWPSVRLDEIAEQSSVAMDPQAFPGDGFFYVGLENVEPVTGDAVNLQQRLKSEVKSRAKVFSEDYVLYGRLRPNLRKVFWAEGEYGQGLCSTEFIVLKPVKKLVLPVVLRAILASEAIAQQLTRFQIGAALPRVSPDDFFRTSIPLPPLRAQEKMAARLAELKAERLRLKERLLANPREIDAVVSDLGLP